MRSDLRCKPLIAVGKVRWNVEAIFATHGHELQAFNPAGNKPRQDKCRGLAASKATVELFTIDKGAGVINGNGVSGQRFFTFCFNENLVLKPGGCRDNNTPKRIVSQEFRLRRNEISFFLCLICLRVSGARRKQQNNIETDIAG